MDEWHAYQSAASLIKFHTNNNIPGAGQGPLFFFLLTDIFLAPFAFLHVIDRSLLHDPFTPAALSEYERIFVLLRIFILMFGVGTLLLMYQIARKQLKINPFIPVLLFTLTPIWIILSSYYKFDIALIFWIVATVFMLLRFSEKRTPRSFWFTAVVTGLAISTKISGIPLIPLYIFSYYLFLPRAKRSISILIIGLVIILVTFCLVGIPDVLFFGRTWGDYVSANVFNKHGEYLLLGMPQELYLITQQFPTLFGNGLITLVLLACIYYAYLFTGQPKYFFLGKNKSEAFLIAGLLFFALSLVPLQINATGERALVLLPFFVLVSCSAMTKLVSQKEKYARVLYLLIVCVIGIQVFETAAWLAIKLGPDPRAISSSWIVSHIHPGTTIGLENPPIYQGIPNVLMEDYSKASYHKGNTHYHYQIVTNSTTKLAPYVIVVGGEGSVAFLSNSPQKALLSRLSNNGYHIVASFDPNLNVYHYFGNDQNYYIASLIPLEPIDIYRQSQPLSKK